MRVLVTNALRNTGFVVIRKLAAAGHEIVVADSRSLPLGLRSRHVSSFERLPESSAPGYADSLLALVRRTRPDVLLPLRDFDVVSAHREALEAATAVLVAEYAAYRALGDKAVVYELCARFDIAHARVLGTDVESACRSLGPGVDGSPLAVLKPRRDHGAGRGLEFIHEVAQLPGLWPGLERRYGSMIATEFVPGPVDAQNAVHLLFDARSELIEFFVLRKLRQWPPRSGVTVAAVSTHELELVERMLPLFRHLRWRGPAEVELKRDATTGKACVLEINPRFSGTLAFPLAAGVDLVGSMLDASLGRSKPRPLEPYYEAGLHYWNPLGYVRSVLFDIARLRSPGPALRDPVGNPYALSDPAALVGKLILELSGRGDA
jgi:ATP-grasp in the biosynthetic pathway with Ter operon